MIPAETTSFEAHARRARKLMLYVIAASAGALVGDTLAGGLDDAGEALAMGAAAGVFAWLLTGEYRDKGPAPRD